jgi:hypothetical protein
MELGKQYRKKKALHRRGREKNCLERRLDE